MGCTELSSSCCAEIGVPLDLGRCLKESWCCLKEVKTLVMYDMERRMALEPMQGIRESSSVDFGYTDLFCFPVVTSGSL